MDLMAASFIASSTALFGVFGKLIYGMLVDRWDVRRALWLGIAPDCRTPVHAVW